MARQPNPKRSQCKVLERRPTSTEDELDQTQVPDINSLAFAAEAHRQSALVTASPQEPADQAFIDAISEWDDE